MWSWRLGSIRGVDLNIHVTFPLVLVWAAFQFGAGRPDPLLYAIFGAFLILLLFACVLLHEIGHALVALHFRIPVDEIILLPIGGLAKLRTMHDSPKEEFAIALAGPLVNVLIALLCVPLIFLLTDLFHPLHSLGSLGADDGATLRATLFMMARAVQFLSLEALLIYLFFANILLALFNLIPAFPMDGGRILRALLAIPFDYRRATIIAVRTGQFLALLFVILGFRSNPGLLLVALFVFVSGGAELKRIELREVLKRGRVDIFMRRALHTIYPQWNLYTVHLLAQQTGQRAFPVMEDGALLGLITAREMSGVAPMARVNDVMVREFAVIPPAHSLYDAQMTLQDEDQFAGVVMEDGRLLGVLSLEDIDRAYHSLQRSRRVQVI